MADLSTQIESLANGPQKVVNDGHEIGERPMADLILADQYLALKAARANKSRGIAFTKMIPAGAMDDCQGSRSGSSIWP